MYSVLCLPVFVNTVVYIDIPALKYGGMYIFPLKNLFTCKQQLNACMHKVYLCMYMFTYLRVFSIPFKISNSWIKCFHGGPNNITIMAFKEVRLHKHFLKMRFLD